FGWGGGSIVFARNKYERIERALDLGAWWVIGLGTPLVLEKLFCAKLFNPKLAKQFPQWLSTLNRSHITPLRMPLQLLDEANWAGALKETLKNPAMAHEIERWGFKSVSALKQAVASKAFRAAVRNGKLSLMLFDLGAMASKGQLYYWGKNWVTQKLSGQKGFVGEFNYTDEAFRKKEGTWFDKTKKVRMALSTGIGYASALAFPALMLGLLKSPVKAGAKLGGLKGLTAGLKKLVPHFNYTDAVFMTRWVILWHNTFNWALPALLSARNGNELRENFVRTNLIDFFFFFGDGMLRSAGAGLLQKTKGHQLEGPLLSKTEKALGKIPVARPLGELFEQYGKHSQIYKVARGNLWASLGINAAVLSVISPLVNNWFTHHKVDQEKLNQQKLNQEKQAQAQLDQTRLTQTPLPQVQTAQVSLVNPLPALPQPAINITTPPMAYTSGVAQPLGSFASASRLSTVPALPVFQNSVWPPLQPSVPTPAVAVFPSGGLRYVQNTSF
ncbi:MAG: hypothetical protein VKJ06_04215, partial [Vampirovibrionales bacterium]|nr:hypothetical protein [Vampirovibrionales bacterium]